MPDRIQLRRTKGWRLPKGAVKVDRSTKWGNPWRVEQFYHPGVNTLADAAAEAVQHFRDMLKDPHLSGTCGYPLDLEPLRGCDLACWCPPGSPCHADVLLELANA